MANRSVGLNSKHEKALQLIEEGKLTLKQISEAIGVSYSHFLSLYEGNIEKAGNAAALFHARVEQIDRRHVKEIKSLLKENKKLALLKINEFLKTVKERKPTKALVKDVTGILNSLAKLGPKVEVNSFSVYNTLTDKDLVNEFKRLNAIAENALVGRAIRGSAEEGTRALFGASTEGNNLS